MKTLSSLLLLLLATFHLLPPLSAATAPVTGPTATSIPGPTATSDFIRSVCNNTIYTDLCLSSFSRFSHVINRNPAALSRIGVAVSHSVVRGAAAFVSGLSGRAPGIAAGTIDDCISTIGDAADQTRDSLGQLRRIAAGKGGDFKFAVDTVLTEMSAALTNEDTCLDEIESEAEGPVKKKVVEVVTKTKKFTSIALAFVNYYAKNGLP